MSSSLIFRLVFGRLDLMKRQRAREDNTARVAAIQNLRASGAAGSHGDRRTKRLRTRSSQNRQAIEDQKKEKE